MTPEPTTIEKLRGLPWSVATNAANAVWSQFTLFGSLFVIFLNALGLSKTEIGFILALIPFSGLVAPLVAPATARYGYKRVFVLFYALRKLVAATLIFAPWIWAAYGPRAAFVFATVAVGAFAVVRSVEETAYLPWVQEFVPNSVRGKYSAMSNLFTALAGFIAVAVAGIVIDRATGFSGFIGLMVAGAAFGLLSVWFSTFIPGGAAAPEVAAGPRNLRDSFLDGDFRLYLIGVALISFGTVPLASFLPLYLEEVVALSSGSVVLVQLGTLAGTLLSSYVWGWAADRYGSKPVMLSGVALLVLSPILWWLIPRNSPLSLAAALAFSFTQGTANLAWGIGAGRLLFVSIVPTAKKMDYMAVYFAWVGIVAGISQVGGGVILDFARGLAGTWYTLEVDQYTPLFLIAILLPASSILIFRWVRGDSPFSTVQFAGVFLRGNPFLAVGSVISFHRARGEYDAVRATERMGVTKSPLTVDELLDALDDPRFNVRFEAIISMARMPSDKRLVDALTTVLSGKSPALAVIAAWALGRIGDARGAPALRQGLESPYRSIRAHCVRALGTLGDTDISDLLLERMDQEPDEGLRVAYAYALGKLAVAEAVRPMLTLLRDCTDDSTCSEVALALARIVGGEHTYIQLVRQARRQPGTAAAQHLSPVLHRLTRHSLIDGNSRVVLQQCIDLFAREDLDSAIAALSRWILSMPMEAYRTVCREILAECALRLGRSGAQRIEYLLLALHALHEGPLPVQQGARSGAPTAKPAGTAQPRGDAGLSTE